MGTSGSTLLEINLDDPSRAYFPGEQISGTILLYNERNQVTFDEIFLEFNGLLGYTTREQRSHQNGNRFCGLKHYIQHHNIGFLSTRTAVVRPPDGECEIALYRGQHSWPFVFRLPDDLPPSFTSKGASYPYVKYYIQLDVKKPWYKSNSHQTYPLTIIPHVNLFHIPNAQNPIPFCNQNRRKAQLSGSILRGCAIAGELVPVQINFQNPKRCNINQIEARLIQHIHIARLHYQENIFCINMPNLSDVNDTELHEIFNLQIPSESVIPTCTSTISARGRSIEITVDYELQLKVKIRGIFTDFSLGVPVIIGTESTPDPQSEQSDDQSTMPRRSAPDLNCDPPPPYDRSVSDEKQDQPNMYNQNCSSTNQNIQKREPFPAIYRVSKKSVRKKT